eukprot:TRINITY_DN765_c0_g1_i1.p1 TRINITY_DN765_c0_g1~~TRINITY_DN765_c0_g1_i1.p1  ORF type:complete len:182 (+),score=31.79 TRINITY_DN765_c0_g1_i1:197-742(+)
MDFEFNLKHQKEKHIIKLDQYSTIYDLKLHIMQLTDIAPSAQKIIGIPWGSLHPPPDDTLLSHFEIKKPQPLMLLTTTPFTPADIVLEKEKPVVEDPSTKLSKLSDTVEKISEVVNEGERLLSSVTILILDQNTEILTQTLLKLDAIEDQSLRQARRDVIRKVVTLQERIDGLKERVKNKL